MGEPGVEALAVGAVAVEVEGRGLAQGVAAGHQADGDARAVRRRGPEALADIGVGVEGAFHRGFLEHLLGAAGQFQLAHLGRTVEGLVAQADHRAVELQAVLDVEAVGGVRQLQRVGRRAFRVHLDDRQAAFAQAEDEGARIQADPFQHARLVMGDQLAPVGAGGLGFAGLVEGEVDAGLVAADQPGPLAAQLAVVGVVLVVLFPGRQAGPGACGGVGVQYPGLAGGLAVEQQDQLALGAGAVAVEEEAAVALLEHQLGAGFAQAVAMQAVRAMGVVQFAEEQRGAVVGPGHAAVALLEGQGADFTAGQLLDVELVGLVAAGVQAVGQARMVGADAEGADGEEAAGRQFIGVQQQLLAGFVQGQGTVGRARAAVVARVLVAGGGALVVEPGAPGHRQGEVGFADAALDFLEQRLAQCLLAGHLGVQPGVLRFEVGEHFGGVALFQPAVGVGTGFDAGNRGLGHGYSRRQGGRATAGAPEPGKAAIISALLPALPRTPMTENDYLLAWAAYGLAALGCLLVWYRLTGWMWRWLREPLRLLAAVLLLTPTIVDPAKDLFAPAVAITALDLVFKVGNNAWKATLDLTMYSIIAFALYLVYAGIRWPIERKRQERRAEREAATQAEEEPTLNEVLRERGRDADTRYDQNGDRRLRIEPRL
ncbi:hypothetical protein D9M70_297460 [compost metagenome]